MTKEFGINDILSAVNSIYKIEKKKSKTTEKKDSTDKNDIFFLNSNRLKPTHGTSCVIIKSFFAWFS